MTQGGPAAVHQELVSVWVMTYDPRQHPHCNVLKATGADERLLHIYTKRIQRSPANACNTECPTGKIILHTTDRKIHSFQDGPHLT